MSRREQEYEQEWCAKLYDLQQEQELAYVPVREQIRSRTGYGMYDVPMYRRVPAIGYSIVVSRRSQKLLSRVQSRSRRGYGLPMYQLRYCTE